MTKFMAKGRDNYIIDFSKCLGQGATASVFLGISKDDGSLYAIKCSRTTLKKEIKILQDLEHENIIKFYDSFSNGQYAQIIVMEYCNQGSLFDFIEIQKGLCDNMFLKTLECLSNSMMYLRTKNYIHRDIKPGNMMIHLDCMGHYHVKLGDMGTARILEEDNTFETLCGTEEYLHPDMYIRFLDNEFKSHKGHVDLFSIGVTLYHASTNQMPFMPFNYARKNPHAKSVLRYMYENKPDMTISAHQNSSNLKDITWSKTLPDECRMSNSLKALSAPLIGYLMDLSPNNTFERFFEESSKILQQKRCLIFNGKTGELNVLYMKQLSYSNISEECSKNLNFAREEMVLLRNVDRLEPSHGTANEIISTIPIKGHMKYDLTKNTILIVYVGASDVSNSDCRPLSPINSDNYKCPSSRFTTQREAVLYSKYMMKEIYDISRNAEYLECQIKCYKTVIHSFNENAVIKEVKALNESLPWRISSIRDMCIISETIISAAEKALSHTNQQHSDQREHLERFKSECVLLRNKSQEGQRCGSQYYNKLVTDREMDRVTERLLKKFQTLVDETNCNALGCCNNSPMKFLATDDIQRLASIIEDSVNEIKLIPLEAFNCDKRYKTEVWQRHMQQFQLYQMAKNFLVHKQKLVVELHKIYVDWLKQVKSVMQRVTQLKDFLDRQEERRLNLRTKYIQVHNFLEQILSENPSISNDIPSLSIASDGMIRHHLLKIKERTGAIKESIQQFYPRR